MPTAIQHRPMSQILAPAPEVVSESEKAALAAAAAPVVAVIPDKYAGKSVEQVIDMHQNAEKRLGEIQNEVGSLRGLVTDLSAIQRTSAAPEVSELEEVNVSGDELLASPREAVMSILQPELDKIVTKSETDKADTQVLTETNALMRDYPNMTSTIASEEFQVFAGRTAGRQADFNVAASGEGLDQVHAARRLLEDFTDFKALVTPVADAAPTPVELARTVATEGANTGAPVSSQQLLHESDVIALIQTDVAKYRSPSYQKELLAAIKEGRFVKNS